MPAYAEVPDVTLTGGSPARSALGRLPEFEAILARNWIGRIAFAVEDRVTVLPVQYMCTGGWIYGRTTTNPLLRDLLKQRRVAFEVDEHNSRMEWTSVVVRGPFFLIDAGQPGPTQTGEQLFRMRVAEISGRSSGPVSGSRVATSNPQSIVVRLAR